MARKPRTYFQQLAAAVEHEERLNAQLVDVIRKHNKLQFIFEHNETKDLWRTTLSKLENYNQNGFENKRGFQDDLPATLYYLKVSGGHAYKIGITNRSVLDRYYKYEHDLLDIIGEVTFDEGKVCRDMEKRLLQHFSLYKYKGSPLLSSGNSELFEIDVLGLDNVN